MGSVVFDFGDINKRYYFIIADDGVIVYRQKNRWVCVCHHEAHSPSNMIPAKWSTHELKNSIHFCNHGQPHREDDLPAIVSEYTTKDGLASIKFSWYKKGLPNREIGPWTYSIDQETGIMFGDRYCYRYNNLSKEVELEEFKTRHEFVWLKPYQYKHDKRYEEFEMEWTGETFVTEHQAYKKLNEQ